jgi:hypothetical protein
MIRSLLLCLTLLALTTSAHAQAVVAYNETTSFWSLTPGADIEADRRLAVEDCEANSGGPCQVLLECPAGWIAVAESGEPELGRGFGCGMETAAGARMMALVACTAAANRICDLRGAISPQGEQFFDSSTEGPATTAMYAQYMLDGFGYDIGQIDGEIGRKTKTALREWEASVGLPPTGEVTNDIVSLMFYAAWGRQAVVDAMKDFGESISEDFTMIGRALSERPLRPLNYELARADEEKMPQILGVVVSAAQSSPCVTSYWERRRPFAYAVNCEDGNRWLLTVTDENEGGLTKWVDSTWVSTGSGTPAEIPL